MSEQGFTQKLLDQLDSLSVVTETFELPTKGKLDGISPTVTMRMMTTQEEKIRTGSKGSFWKVLSSIMNNCIVEPKGLDTYKLTVVDFMFLMYKMRIISYGNDYKLAPLKCPNCSSMLTNVSVDLDKLKLVKIDEMEDYPNFTEPFKITLPRTKWTIECRMLRINEYDMIESEADKMLKEFPNYEGDPIIPLRLARQIVSINGEKVDPLLIQTIVDKLPAADENAITQAFNKITMGLSPLAEYKCPRCGEFIYIPISQSEEFFRPSN